jgi:hypothetical protein
MPTPAGRPKGIYVTTEELDATRGLSDLAVRLYWCLRTLMDIHTGITGLRRRISYQALREESEVLTPKGKGFQRRQASEKALRCALAGLQRAGLLEAIGPLVFRLAKAALAAARPPQTGQEQGTVAEAAEPTPSRAADPTGQVTPRQTGRTSELGVNSTLSVAAAHRAPAPVDNSPGKLAAEFLHRLSQRLGYPITHRPNDPLLARWSEEGLSFSVLEQAVKAAREARNRDQSCAPLNPGFIAAFLAPPDDWRTTWSGIVGQGKALGIVQQPGELAPYFKARVFQRAAAFAATA